MIFIEGKLVIDWIGIDHNAKYRGQNNCLDTLTFTHCNMSCNIACCGNKVHQTVTNMMLSQYLELKLSTLRRTTVSG